MKTIRTILLATDFSTPARHALNHALSLAREYQAQIHILHIVPVEERETERRVREDDVLHRTFGIPTSHPDRLQGTLEALDLEIYEVTQHGHAAGSAILDYAGEIDADLIIMGSHGRSGPARWLLGSVAEKVVRHAKCPVLTIRQPHGAGSGLEPDGIQKILVPLDFSDRSEDGLSAAKQLAARYGATLQLVHIVDLQSLPAFYGLALREITDGLIERSQENLTVAFEKAPGPQVPFETATLLAHAAAGIVDFAERNDSDLIVMPSSGLTGIDRWLIGSTAERVVRASPCPVLTLKEDDEPVEKQHAEKIQAVVKG